MDVHDVCRRQYLPYTLEEAIHIVVLTPDPDTDLCKTAENLQVQNLEIRKRVSGPEHPDTLTSMNSLASNYRQATCSQLCDAEGLAATVKVVLLEGSAERFNNVKPWMGEGLAPADEDWCTGTLGGYVFVKSGGEAAARQYALTCHHVLFPAKEDGTAKLARADPVVPGSSAHVRVEQPSRADYDAAQSMLAAQIQEYGQKVGRIEEVIAQGLDSASRQRARAQAHERQNTLEEIDRADKAFDRRFGVSWAIGDSGVPVDWGLIRVDDHRAGGTNEWRPIPRSYDLDQKRGLIQMPAKKSRPLKDGDTVFMCGRSSGVRAGTISSVDARVRWPELPSSATEKLVVSRGGLAFAVRGDSGAWVMDRKNELVGMVVGGPTGIG
ncbi:MAG: hypothetical protein M1826_005574 [Phylliscum demangeonii]|nr:MAG: hypothetical protein M1826_005574 [Phylliscum demangeonii]